MFSVQPYNTNLCKDNAYWMARLSKEVYKKTSDIDQKPNSEAILESIRSEDNGFFRVKGFDRNSAQAALVEHEKFVSIVFRGTNEIEDWIDNINAFSVKALFGEFHRGFLKSVDDLWLDIEKELESCQSEQRKPVFIAGHSLGGAMATITAAKFIHEDKPFISVYTFGQPRALSQDTARLFNVECKNRYFRFHNNNDLVTRVPARLMGYSHVGSYLYITNEGKIHEDVGNWFRFLDHVEGAFESVKQKKSLDMISDHDMDEYLKHIKNFNIE
ncbi:putative Lipase, class 3 [Vibrio nigripulchritudo SOn1]|uniref:Lipase, class 3 n=1 Tax=Vibrio nigripulchritudo SOn1 TaxID=1238450 RepID=A0AAV2VT89_9VIBR|nr:lipase family protein [Vibrio nigripulchritudo]CCO47918.1 putative Lipase, class 3 [Vibrio nigripulchritudo SOn1]